LKRRGATILWLRSGHSGDCRVPGNEDGTVAKRQSCSRCVAIARLFVQWIAHHDGDLSVDNTIEIKELGALKVDVVDYTFDSDQTGLSVQLETIDPNGNADQTYELHVASPTEYKFGPAGTTDTGGGVPKKKS
jgi:hypothetical protein